MTRIFVLLVFTTLTIANPHPVLADDAALEVQQQRAAYTAARLAARGPTAFFRTAAEPLKDYPLYPYLEYAHLSDHLVASQNDDVERFLSDHAELPIAGILRSRWLRALAKRRDWDRFMRHYPADTTDTRLRCHQLAARLTQGESVAFDESNRDLWFVGNSQTDACDPIFAFWKKAGALDARAHLDRAKLAVTQGNHSLAKYLVRKGSAFDQAFIDAWIAAWRSPRMQFRKTVETQPDPQLAGALIKRLAKSDPELADLIFGRYTDQVADDLVDDVAREIAIQLAADDVDDAISRLKALPESARDQRVHEWHARVAIKSGAWEEVIHATAAMEESFAKRPRWAYWRAQALEKTGRTAAAEELYAQAARDTDFYAFLSADRIGQPYSICPDDSPVSESRLNGVRNLPAFVRATELRAVGQIVDARREWREMVETLDDDAAIAAAELAHLDGWHHQVILTLADRGAFKRYAQRFPLAWQTTVEREAAKYNVSPAMVYAIARAESALADDAISHADARGLMQLTVPTARAEAKRRGLKRPDAASLLDPETNIPLGTAHLDYLFDKYGHILPVIASYNAGPTPISRWIRDLSYPRDPDRWIESVPYYETRDYLPRILEYRAIYDWRLRGQVTRLSDILRPLNDKTPRPGAITASPADVICAH